MATAPKIAAYGHVGWWEALNPPIYLISVLPALTAFTIASRSAAPLIPFLLGTLGVVLLQHAVNVFNDITDWKRNADVEKPDSWVRFHRENTRVAEIHALLSVAAGACVGLSALHLADRWWLIGVAAPLVFLGLLYNFGKVPISYGRHSEWVTGVCYGPGVFGCLWLLRVPRATVPALFG
ncbi:MAG TPA: UbiA family prenyltransferase, partial [Bdellovibrionota bacterium]|nr:UbiA family prenyltransferase [Bdellovibrionota bacterium]